MSIAVKGLGIICAIGNGTDEVLDSLRKGESGISMMRHLQSSHKELPVGEVALSDDEMKTLLGMDKDKIISRTTLLGAIAVKQALADAGMLDAEGKACASLKGKKVVLISGTTVGGMDVTERLFNQMREEVQTAQHPTPNTHHPSPITHHLTPITCITHHDCGSSTKDIAEICGLECDSCTISTACSSAVNSIIVGSEMLSRGEADIVIAGGTEALSKFHLNGFNTLMILDKEKCRPFDATRAGLNLGEGAAFVVLKKDEADAKAYITGCGNACDAFHQTASSDNGEGAYLAMSEALRSAGLESKNIQYVNAHGTGTPNNDVSESVALRRIFGDALPPVSSTKGMTGHTTSASGSIETVISILAMQNDFIPVNVGWSTKDDACIAPSNGVENIHIDNVMCNSFGFGGNDSSIVISREDTCSESATLNYESEIVSDVTIDDVEQLKASKEFISPMEGRRMGKLMKAATMSSLKALKEGGIDCPDAIITATALGMLETSEKFLVDMCDNGEELLKPTLFMQSTHNTIGSAIAIRTKCHGYNITYTQGAESLDWALRDARRLIATGKAKTVLVGCHDEATALYQSFCERLGQTIPTAIYSRSILLRRKE